MNNGTIIIYLIVIVGVAWDWVNQKLYWTDPCASDIEVYDPVTAHRRVLYNSTNGLRHPSGIVVDPSTGYDCKLAGIGADLMMAVVVQVVILD